VAIAQYTATRSLLPVYRSMAGADEGVSARVSWLLGVCLVVLFWDKCNKVDFIFKNWCASDKWRKC